MTRVDPAKPVSNVRLQSGPSYHGLGLTVPTMKQKGEYNIEGSMSGNKRNVTDTSQKSAPSRELRLERERIETPLAYQPSPLPRSRPGGSN